VEGVDINTFLTELRGIPNKQARRKRAKEIAQDCQAKLDELHAARELPSARKRPRAEAGAMKDRSDSEEEDAGEAVEQTKKAKTTEDDDPDFVAADLTEEMTAEAPPVEARPEEGAPSDAASSEDEDEEADPEEDAAGLEEMPTIDALTMTREDTACLTDTSAIPFLPEAPKAESREAEEMIACLEGLKSAEPPSGWFDGLDTRLKAGVEPMEYQKRTVKFLHDSISAYKVAGLALGCGLGKTFTALMYLLKEMQIHGRRLCLVNGKKMLYETWAREISGMLCEGTYTVANIGASSFRQIDGFPVWKDAVLQPIEAGLSEGRLVILYVQSHVLNNPHGLLGLLMGVVDMAPEGATLMVEECHEHCRNNNVPSEALLALAKACKGTVFISATPVMGDGDEARHMMLTGDCKLPREISQSDALKVWRALCFRMGQADVAGQIRLPPLATWILRVPPLEISAAEASTSQARNRAVVHGNGVATETHTKYQAAVEAAVTLVERGCSPCICAENRKGVAAVKRMLEDTLEAMGVKEVRCFLLSGDVSDAQRESTMETMRQLHEEGKVTCVCITPQVAGAGLNMPFLGAMLVIGMTWTAQELEQIIARIHRLGQKKPCLCITMAIGGPNSPDQGVVARVQDKMTATSAFYGQFEDKFLPDTFIDDLGVCPIEDVGAVVKSMHSALLAGTGLETVHEAAGLWSLFSRIGA
jgi:superfamily II DNA or RNA helicase